MSIKFSDILDLFEFVNFGSPYQNEGYICKATGKSYFYSEFGDNEEALPDDIDSENYLIIPDKNELNLGQKLVFDFIRECLPSEYENVSLIFKRKGAYSRFKALLESSSKIEMWYAYETKQTEQALREWCTEQNIETIG